MKRACVYITGHFRNLDETWNNYMKIFKSSEQIQVDFYFILWNVKNSNDNTLITSSDIIKLCPNPKCIILLDSTIKLESAYSKPIIYQLYLLEEAFKVLPDNYNFYIRLRTDLYFFDKFDLLENIATCSSDLIIPSKVWYNHDNYHSCVFNDYLYISNYDTGNYISKLYSNLYLFEKNLFNEKYLYLYISRINPTITKIDMLFNLDRRTKGSDIELLESRELTQLRKQLESN